MKQILLLLLLTTSYGYGQNFEAGKTIFEQNCSSCHKMDRKLVGPALQNTVADQGREWTQKWIYNSQSLIEAGDKHAVEIYNEYNQMAMPAYSWFSEDELGSLVDYLEGWKTNQPAEVVAVVTEPANTNQPQTTKLPQYFWLVVGITLSVLISAAGLIHWSNQGI